MGYLSLLFPHLCVKVLKYIGLEVNVTTFEFAAPKSKKLSTLQGAI